jgi:hypothetical protein
VAPASYTRGVDPASSVTVRFSHAMSPHTELLVWLHEGSVAQPVVPGSWSWSADRTVLTFTPDVPLSSGSTFVLHLAPALLTADGEPLDHGRCQRLGGERVADGVTFSFTTA